jgi:hypothetical protein
LCKKGKSLGGVLFKVKREWIENGEVDFLGNLFFKKYF